MQIKTRFFGEQTIDPDSIITFPRGIPGLENQTRYKLFHQEGSEIVYWLQSIDDEDLVFSVAHPMHFNINYQFTLTSEEETLLQVDNVEDLMILVILHRDDEADPNSPLTIKGALKSPLLINAKTRIGIQKVLHQVEQSITLIETKAGSEIDFVAA